MNSLEICLSKTFQRLRGKSQIFSSQIDDHYHTRLSHTLEVEKVALLIADKLLIKYKGLKIDKDMLSSMCLLHDVGHTPYGHAGERELHSIISGKEKIDGLPNFELLDVTHGFKHNINSGLIFKESIITIDGSQINDEKNVKILEGIIKHSKFYYKNENKFDYGLSYVTSGFSNQDFFNNENSFCSIEGFILKYSDEIAQIASDFCDLNYNGAPINEFMNIENFKKAKENKEKISYTEFANNLCNVYIDLFCNSITPNIDKIKSFDDQLFIDDTFKNSLNEFDRIRSNIIKNYDDINSFDNSKKDIIKTLFKYYYLYPTFGDNLLEDFYHRIIRIKHRSTIFDNKIKDIESIYPININKKEFEQNLKTFLFEEVINKVINNEIVSKRELKRLKTIFKMYIYSIAIHISKMTDNYANKIYLKIE